MMLPIDPTKKITFQRSICNGDLVIVYERHDNMKAIEVREGSELQNRFGVFKHSDWLGKHFGSKVLSNKGGFVYLLAPTPELWTLVLSHRTQILYIADISFVVSYLEIVPGCMVLESGTGSGSLTTSIARAVAPTGHVYTFDFHEQRAALARQDFEKTALNSLITVGVRDIQGEGFPDDFCSRADSVFLDLPQPWLAIPSAAKTLKPDGVLCSFSPCIEQVQRSCETLGTKFTGHNNEEILSSPVSHYVGLLFGDSTVNCCHICHGAQALCLDYWLGYEPACCCLCWNCIIQHCILCTRASHAEKRACLCDCIQPSDDDHSGYHGLLDPC